MAIGRDSPIISGTRGTSLVAIMRAQRNDGDVDFEVVNLVDHAVLLVDAPTPCIFKPEVLQVLHLSSACAGMPKGIDERHHILLALQSREVRLKESGRF